MNKNKPQEEKIEIDQDELISAVKAIVKFCKREDMSELLAYMAMISITNTMEESLGFGYERKES